MSDLMWRATFRSLPTGTFAQGAKVPHGAGIRLSVPSAELCRKFSIFGQGGPEGTPFNFFASAKKFFKRGACGVRGVLAVKKIWSERIRNEKRVQNGLQTKRLYRTDEPSVLHGGWGVCFKCKIVFLQKTHQNRQIWISSPYSSFYTFDQNIYILYCLI